MYKLYGWKLTGSAAIEAAFAEAEVEYELIPVNRQTDEQLGEAYKRINPRQQIPALVLPDGSVMTEGAAMLLHIADAFPYKGLAPKPGTAARAQHDRWLFFFAVNVYEGQLRQLRPHKFVADANCAPAVKTAADAYVERHFRIYDSVLDEGPYLFGERFSTVDIYVWMLAQWADMGWLKVNCPKVWRLADTVMKRPRIWPVHRAHFGEGVGMTL